MIGTKIGHYLLVRQIGEGGTGAVYLAKHHSLGTHKAIKVLLPQYSQNLSLIWRFQNEAITVARLRHRNIVSVDDFGQLPDGQWYIMMPFLEGVSLHTLLYRCGRLPIHQSLHILAQVCAALHAVHSTGVIHRDLKPANVFLTASDDDPWRVTLLDFGLAKRMGSEASEYSTDKGASFGTPAFMAAEMIEDASRADPRSDVFAIGVIAYVMVAGEYPFGAHPAPVLYRKQMNERPRRPEGIPPAWADAILSALERCPDDRPQSAKAFAISLAAATPAQPPKVPNGADILAAVARELVTPPRGPGATRTLAEQADTPPWSPWSPVPTAPAAARLRPAQHGDHATPTLRGAMALRPGVPMITATATAPTLSATPLHLGGLWDVLLHPARSRRRLILWLVIAIVAAALVAALCRDAQAHVATGPGDGVRLAEGGGRQVRVVG